MRDLSIATLKAFGDGSDGIGSEDGRSGIEGGKSRLAILHYLFSIFVAFLIRGIRVIRG
jgi:hypothetical protein